MKTPNDTSKMSRRAFLKTSAGALAISGLAWPENVRAGEIGQMATLIDLSLCDGCPGMATPACVCACKEINKDRIPPVADPIPVPWPRKTVEDWSRRRDVSNRLTPYNYIYVHRADVEHDGQRKTLFVPRRCMHCDNPACATICPFSANHKHRNGAVVIDQNLCFGGAKCKTVCPWEIPQRQSGVGIYLHVMPEYMGNGVMYKCDLCHERISRGEHPACIDACPQQALLIGTREEIHALADARVRDIGGHLYGKHENGGTSTLYVSPVPFELINRTMKKGAGMPDMKPDVQRQMAGTDALGKTVLAAPALGIAAGIAGAYGWLAGRRSKLEESGETDG